MYSTRRTGMEEDKENGSKKSIREEDERIYGIDDNTIALLLIFKQNG